MKSNIETIYFKNLNGLRFIAASLVIVSHLEQMKSLFGRNNFFQKVKFLGENGVTLFFVLSGFLITFLLLTEIRNNGFIDVRKFYKRRMLRIWPLYFLIVFLALFILPHFSVFQIPYFKLGATSVIDYIKIGAFFVVFLPNLLMRLKIIPFATQTWSIGTEEQFYLVWPWIISGVKKLLPLFVILIIGYELLLSISFYIDKNNNMLQMLFSFIETLQVNALVLGAVGAYLLFNSKKLLRYIIDLRICFLSFITLVVIFGFAGDNFYFQGSVIATCFTIIILNLVENSRLKTFLENRWIDYFGKISYGLYMFHQMAIVMLLNLFPKIDNVILYLGTFMITILVSIISYEYFEKAFLSRKKTYKVL